MDWKKIMSNRKAENKRQMAGERRDADRKKERRQDRKKELEQLILAYTEELAEDINLRLLTQQEIGPAGFWHDRYRTGKVLYVESIIVTDMRYPKKKKRDSSITGLGTHVKTMLKRR